MDLLALVLVPFGAAVAAALDRARGRRLAWLVGAAALHLALLVSAWAGRLPDSRWLWLGFDPLGALVLTLVSVVFLAVACYSVGSLRSEIPRGGRAFEPCLLAFLGSASVVCLTDQFGVLWVAVEATTLATAPLIYHPRDRHSIEAVWKYLLLCSVGIALALLGTFMLALAQGSDGAAPTLERSAFLAHGAVLQPVWFKAAFVFLFVGYGTKAGLVPMHSWLPDAHGESPSPISALLSGALLNCAFLAILRVVQVAHAGGHDGIVAPVFVGFGLASVLVASALLLRQRNYKRLFAYSSIEHMGILAVGCGLGQLATFGALLHMLGSSLAKALLFLVAGNLQVAYGTKVSRDVSGVTRRLPVTGGLLILGFLALSGAPPFAPFFSELWILRGAIESHRAWVAALLLALQTLAFVGISVSVIRMAHGAPDGGPQRAPAAPGERESLWLVVPPAALLACALALGVFLLPPIRGALAAAAISLGGTAP